MSASSEIRFKIGGDTSSLSRAFVQAESVAAAAGKQLHKKFGLQDSLKAGIIALGLNIEKISEKIAEMFTGGSQEAWKEGLDAAKDAARIIEESALKRMSISRQIAQLEKDIARNKEDESFKPKSETIQLPGRFAPGTRQLPETFIPGGTTTRNTESEAEASARANKAIRDRLEREAKIAELEERQKRTEEQIADARHEMNAAGLEGQEKINSLIEQSDEALHRLQEARKKGAETSALELDFLRRQKVVREAIAAMIKDADEGARRRLEEEKRIAEDRVRTAERLVETQDRIQQIEGETAALGETTSERIERLRKESYDLLVKASDLNRSEDDRARLRVDAAEKRADAAKTEYEYKNKTATIEDSLDNGKGKNTTGQGILANRAARAAAAARKARAQGRFGEAVKQEGIARDATEQFQTNDRAGMAGAMAAPPSDPRFGGIAARNSAIDQGLAARHQRLLQPRGADVGAARKEDKGGKNDSAEVRLLRESKAHLKNIEDSLKPKEVK